MAAGLSIHVVDVSRGVVATGMRVDVYRCEPRASLASGRIAANGTLNDPALAATMSPGAYEAVFHVADYFRACGAALPAVPFLDVVTYRFGIASAEQHYHLPMKLTPWGYSCFRGGA
jgi:5-hydroxyisourate hydrolase